MDGGSTIWAPNVPIALPDIPHGACAETQPASKGCGGVAAARARGGASRLILKGTLIHRARVGAGQALGALSWIEGRRLIGRGREPDGGEGQPPPLSIDSRGGDRARVRLSAALGRHTVLPSNEEILELAGDGGTPSIGRGGARERWGVAAGGHGERCEYGLCGRLKYYCAGAGSIVDTARGTGEGTCSERSVRGEGGRYASRSSEVDARATDCSESTR